MTQPSLRLSEISCVRGGRLLFRGLDLSLASGESALLRGPNGTGKSSLIRIAAGLLRPWSGDVARDGRLALSDENSALTPTLPLARALLFWARLDGRNGTDVAAALDLLDLTPMADIPVRMLSTGQRKRAMLARVVASGAEIWLLDEPANGLDHASEALLGGVMTRHLAGGGIILAASHQPLPLPQAQPIDLAAFRPVAEEA